LDKYEVLTRRVGEADKRRLQAFVHWLAKGAAAHMAAQHPNLRIPGQLSYDRKDLAREAVLLVVGDETPAHASLFHLLAALEAGSGVAISCVSEGAWRSWKPLADAAWAAGIARANLEIYMMDQETLGLTLRDPSLSSVYVEGPAADAAAIFKLAVDPAGITRHMRALHHSGETPAWEDHAAWLNLYLWTRSLAVNTMRHGAPLELET
jgi:RHH-type proline utilization regulon transcriptional repressor/proline dehydrogenase/delta 1-pyrroline-5-carboxylate dehydrogenase